MEQERTAETSSRRSKRRGSKGASLSGGWRKTEGGERKSALKGEKKRCLTRGGMRYG